MPDVHKRTDDKFMRTVIISLFLTSIVGIAGWLYTLIVVQTEQVHMKAEIKRLAEYNDLVIEMKAVLTTINETVKESNSLIKTFGAEQSKRGPIVYDAKDHMKDRTIHKQHYEGVHKR